MTTSHGRWEAVSIQWQYDRRIRDTQGGIQGGGLDSFNVLGRDNQRDRVIGWNVPHAVHPLTVIIHDEPPTVGLEHGAERAESEPAVGDRVHDGASGVALPASCR